jgi:hypothetical protein
MQIKTLEDFLSSSVMCFLFCNFHLIKVEKFKRQTTKEASHKKEK